jgi:hypothetical protein
MANDRIYLRCKTCKETVMLWKHYPVGTYLGGAEGGYEGDGAEVLAFLQRHILCHPRCRRGTLGGDPGYETVTESDPSMNAP